MVPTQLISHKMVFVLTFTAEWAKRNAKQSKHENDDSASAALPFTGEYPCHLNGGGWIKKIYKNIWLLFFTYFQWNWNMCAIDLPISLRFVFQTRIGMLIDWRCFTFWFFHHEDDKINAQNIHRYAYQKYFYNYRKIR